MLCKQCGAQIKDTAIFCEHCGARQQSVEDDDKTFGIFSDFSPQNETYSAKSPSSRSLPVNQAQTQRQNYANSPQPQAPQNHYSNYSQPRTPQQNYSNYSQPRAPQQNYSNYSQAPQYSGTSANNKVGFGTAISLFFKNYFNFNGRASKLEYCWVWMLTQAMNVLGYIMSIAVQTNAVPVAAAKTVLGLYIIIMIVIAIPSLSLSIRRLHDIGKPWTWCFIVLIPIAGSIIFLYYMLAKNSDGDNRWGPAPGSVRKTDCASASNSAGTPANTGSAYKRTLSDNDIYVMAQRCAPVDLNTPEAKSRMDEALRRLIPTYTGIENLSGAIMICDKKILSGSIASANTNTLFMAFKALCYYMGQGCDVNILGSVRQEIVSVLKSRL